MYSTHADHEQDSLEEVTVAKKEMINHQEELQATLSVAEEIRKLQQEINKVAVENVKFPTWKKNRSVARQVISKDTKEDTITNKQQETLVDEIHTEEEPTVHQEEPKTFPL